MTKKPKKAKRDLEFEGKVSLEDGLHSLIDWRRGDLGPTLRDQL